MHRSGRRPRADRYAGSSRTVRALPEARFALPIPEAARNLGPADAVVAVLGHRFGNGSSELMRLLYRMPGRRYVFTHDGRLLPAGKKLQLRWKLWSWRNT